MDIKVIVACHKKCDVPQDKLYLPVHAGRALHDDIGFTGDNTGDNISTKNPGYCELTALYWAWKNVDADYIGLAHYRRHFTVKNKLPISYEQAENVLGKADVVVPKKRRYYIENLYSHYAHTFDSAPLDKAGEIISEKYPEYVPAFERLRKRTSSHMFNMMIMRKDLLDSYCTWLFDILEELEGKVNTDGMSAFEARFYGRVSELMLDIWLETNGIKYVEIPFVYTGDVNLLKKGYRFLAAKFFGKKYSESF